MDFDALSEQIDQLNQNLKGFFLLIVLSMFFFHFNKLFFVNKTLLYFFYIEIQQKMKTVVDSSTEHNIQPFQHISEEFVQIATNKINLQYQQLNACKTIFRETLDYFKHIPKTGTVDDCTPSQFFELWVKFSVDFRELWKVELAVINAEM